MSVLQPGDYYFEVEALTPLDKGSLYQMLQNAGFGLVVFDQEEGLDGLSIGALATGFPGAKTAPVSSKLTSFSASATRSSVPSISKVAPPPPKAPPITLTRKPLPPPAPAPAPAPNPKLTSVVPSAVRKAAAVPPTKSYPFKVRPPSPPPTTPPPAADSPPPPPDVQYAPPVQQEQVEASPEPVPGGAGEGYNFSPPAPSPPETESVSAPVDDAQLPAPIVDTLESIKSAILQMWQRWAEWGNPFASGPSVSGDEGARFRFMASVPTPLELEDTPVIRWLYAQKLSIAPWDTIRQNFVPTPLRHGRVYEFRILAHDRTAPTRDSVKEQLARMGFAPMKLINLKRHMRMPGRQGASLSLWWGMGQWAKATSVVTQEDPFIFDEVKEVVL
jgi:hypothetical protein